MTQSQPPQAQAEARPAPSLIGRAQLIRLAALVAVYLLIVYVVPRPAQVKPEGWRLLGIFLAAIAGLILHPIPGGAIVLIAVVLSSLAGGLSIGQALEGYSDASVWLLVAAFMISRALINAGLARRMALFFVRVFGKSSLGVCYSLSFSEMALASMIPSNGARSGGVILPILRSICELYGSRPGPTAGVLGAFLFLAVYQNTCISSAMFYTGQASNPLAASFATRAGYEITWASWLAAGIVPGLCSILLVPAVILWFVPPLTRHTPEASEFARRELEKMGPLSKAEKILALVFAGVCLGWVTNKRFHDVDITVVALIGSGLLFLTGVLTWEDVKHESTLWDLYVWYGGLVMFGRALNDAGVTQAFANGVVGSFSGFGWVALFTSALLIYFYAHYGFASITAHILAMYTPFLAVLVAKGAPIGLVAFAFATFVNFSAGLTNYGTTPSPMYFSHEYVTMKEWWRIGFVISLVNLAVWSTIGFAWWKAIGIW
ncbi:MAG: DASS family sodium-coupled anion symporter [Acidobacteria bacterium]|nr:DASS family sodium-coupled anion symporter [Acidobacteriota bacterium]